VETRMERVRVVRSLFGLLPLAALALALTPASPAQTADVYGRYLCTQAKMQG